MKVLVSGGTGYIGSHTAVELLNEGHEVVIADNLSNSEAWICEAIEKITGKAPFFIQADICDPFACRSVFEAHSDIRGVIHFAAFKAVGESHEKPLMYYHNNLVSLINLLETMKDFGTDKLVFSSSCTVYGQPDALPIAETAPIKPAISPYGNTKQIAEEIISDVAAQGGLKAFLLRYFNPIGAHESALIGELPRGVPNNLVPYITQTAIGKREYLRVFGNDYNTPDGSCIRDYIHVTDIARAHISALDKLDLASPGKPQAVNLGTGRGYSVMEVLNTFIKVTGVDVPYKILERRAGDVEQVWADCSLSEKVLGWKARHTLEEMLLSAWNWELMLQKKYPSS